MTICVAIGSEELIACLQCAFAGGEGRDKEFLASADGFRIPVLRAGEEPALRAFTREHFDAIVALLQHEEHDVRHLAAFALGFTGDARSVEPLILLLANQKDPFDDPYCCSSLGSLGVVALEPLFEIALGDAVGRRVRAIWALRRLIGPPIMNFRDTIGSEELIACLQSVLAGRDGRDKECLALFDEVFIRDLGDAGERAVGVFMREHFDSIVGLLQDEEHGVRHLAAFVLGFTGDARSVEPLISLLTNQKDFYDHDYCYWSLRSLGEVALEPLFEIARGDAGERRVQAVQALGHCGAESLPWLRRFAELQALPDGFFSAVYNCGPSALTLVERGLWHANDKQRGDALFAAYCLTGQAFEQGHPVLHELDRDRWGDRMVELLDDSRIASPQLALNVLGYLQVERHLAVVIDSLATADRVDGAFEALGTFHTPLAGIELEKLLDHADLSIACHSAAVILKRSNEESARLERARGVALRAILDLKRDKAWFAAAAQLPTTRPGRELLYATIEDGEKHCRDIAAGVLAQYVFLHGGAIEALTAECSSQVGKVLTAEERRYRSDWERRTLLLPRRV